MFPQKKSGRLWRNFSLQPFFQIQIGIASIIMATLFAVIGGKLLYIHLAELTDFVFEMTGVPEEVKMEFESHMEPLKIQMIGLSLAYVGLNLILMMILTHRLIGPTVAFRRHIRKIIEGNLQYRTQLRKGDAFVEVADDLNQLSAHLQSKS